MGLNLHHSPLVSILLPTHNRADVLSFAIQSVLAQTIQDFELLVVGDGCTDHSVEIVQGFADPRIHWFDLPKAPGFGYANRNIGLHKARGEYIAFMAHDDLWLSDHLEQLLPFFRDEKTEIVYSRPLWVIPFGMIVPGEFNLNRPSTLRAFLNGVVNGIPAGCVIHRRDCLSKYGFWNDELPKAADWDMWARIIKGGKEKNFVYAGDSTCLHFKANWRDDSYDKGFSFRIWRRLFAAGQLPTSLQFNVKQDDTEQQAIWEVMSLDPQEWNKKLRSAIQQVDAQKKLENIKNILALKIYEDLADIYFVRKFYLMIIAPIRYWLASCAQKANLMEKQNDRKHDG
jgi:glycosyltransferase involved in cell wall biosynthesis